jgi:group I intron endonuclease
LLLIEDDVIVYKTTNLVNGKCYIGQDSRDKPDYFGSGIFLRRAIKKYGRENFKKETVAWCYTKEHLNFLEVFYIKFFNSTVPIGYNLTGGGEGAGIGNQNTKGRKLSEGHKNKFSFKGRQHTVEAKRKISISGVGKHFGNKNALGYRLTEGQRKGRSLSLLGNKRAVGYIATEELRIQRSENKKTWWKNKRRGL